MKAILIFVVLTVVQSKLIYENFSFDYSANKFPLAYTTYGNAVELNHKVKLNSNIMNRGGALVLQKPISMQEFEVQVEFTLNSDFNPLGFSLHLLRDEFREEDFAQSTFGYRSDFHGIGLYVFRN